MTKAKAPAAKRIALVGGNLADGTRFEADDDLGDLDAKTLRSLEANGAVAAITTKKGE